jgi:hypothetical protein
LDKYLHLGASGAKQHLCSENLSRFNSVLFHLLSFHEGWLVPKEKYSKPTIKTSVHFIAAALLERVPAIYEKNILSEHGKDRTW